MDKMPLIPQCVICTTNLVKNDIGVLPCGHAFHLTCVSKWVKVGNNCPNCRKKCTLSEVSRLFLDFFDKNLLHESTNKFDNFIEDNSAVGVQELQNRVESLTVKLNCCLKNIEEQYAIIYSKNEELENKKKEIETLLLVTNDYSNLKKEFKKMHDRLKLCDLYKKISRGGISNDVNVLDKYLNDDSTINTVNLLDMVIRENKRLKSLFNESRKQQKCLIEERLKFQKEIYSKNNLLSLLKNEFISLSNVLDDELINSNEKIVQFINSFQNDCNYNRTSMGFDEFPQTSLPKKLISENSGKRNFNFNISEYNSSLFDTPTMSNFDLNDSLFDNKKVLEKLVRETGKKEKKNQLHK